MRKPARCNAFRAVVRALPALAGSLLLGIAGSQAADAGATKRVVAEPAAASPLLLHVPSPEWREQIVYFLMIDRFDDADASNNEQGEGEFDPGSNARYSGGDLRGISRRLDYLHELGATALWITPPVAHRWWNQRANYGGYHGYWGENFRAVDRHFGSLDDYRQLSHALHSRGMYLIQDIVVNHTADYFRYQDWQPGQPAAGFLRDADGSGRQAPSQWPFSLNDASDAQQRSADIYHWTPDVVDYADPRQEHDWQMSGLDDLNTENPLVRRALRQSYAYWIETVGVDAFRVDTAFYVPPDYFEDFLHADDAVAPGIVAAAAATGRRRFHVFGEGFGIDRAFDATQMRKIDSYMRGPQGQPRLPGMIDFPLYGTAQDVFARGHATAELADRLQQRQQLHADVGLLPTFVDNHDVDRFLAGGSAAALRQNLLLLMTVPGIPTIYYGTEQALREPRQAMFAGGYGAGGVDRFDRDAPMYRYLQRAIALRREHPLFAHGRVQPLRDNPAGPGVLAYRVDHQGQSALVMFNTSEQPALLDNLDTGLPAGSRLQGQFAIDGKAGGVTLDAQGRMSRVLPARAGLVWTLAQQADTAAADSPAAAPMASIDTPERSHYRGDVALSGDSAGVADLQLVVDGELARAQPVQTTDDGRWQARVDSSDMLDGKLPHRAVLWSATSGRASNAVSFRVQRQWRTRVTVSDPAGDDHGPSGRYRYPQDATWQGHRPLDLREVQVATSGGALRLDLRMAELMAAWNPANGFDHVAFTVFIELPDAGAGSRLMPLQNGHLAGDLQWHRRLRVHGWSNALFAAAGASANHEGQALTPGARIEVDHAHQRVRLSLPAASLGHPRSLSGARILVTTWDYDGGYKPLQTTASAHSFGGGDGARDPLVMDASAVIVLP